MSSKRDGAARLPLAGAITMISVLVLLMIASAGFAWGAYSTRVDAGVHLAAAQRQKAKIEDAKAAAAQEAEAQREAAQAAQAQAAKDRESAAKLARDSGLTVSPTDPYVAFKVVDGTCTTSMPCAWFAVASFHDCPRGIYVAANIELHDVVVANGNDITGALKAGQGATANINFPGADGSGRLIVTDAHCM